MRYWNQIPLFRILLPFLIGIILALSFQFSITYLYIITAFLSVGILLITRFKNYFTKLSRRWIFGLAIHLFLLVFGILITQLNEPSRKPLYFGKYNAEASIVKLSEDVVSKANSFKCEVEVVAIKSEKIITYSFLIRRCCCGIRIL